MIKSLALAAFLSFMAAFAPLSQEPETANYKCMIQLTNYEGEGAYIVVSILDGEGQYVQTLYVQGEDSEWYRDIEAWWKNLYGIRRPTLDGIVGETITGGQRKMVVLRIPVSKIDAGHTLRFESAVEDQEYYANDISFELTTANLNAKWEGKGFIRNIRIIPQ